MTVGSYSPSWYQLAQFDPALAARRSLLLAVFLPSLLAVSAAMEANPLFEFDISEVDSSVDKDLPAIDSPSAVVLQMMNIKSHVPVVLDIAESNYTE